MANTEYLLLLAGAFVGSYLLGSLSSAILVCRALRIPDPRTTGSGNPGATNVLRSGGKLAAALTLLGDLGKGLVAVLVVRALTEAPAHWCAAAAGAFLGHLYPVFFAFRGGKGVATALGAVFGLSWVTGGLAALTWLALTLAFRFSSVAALGTFAGVPFYYWLVGGEALVTATLAGIALVLFWRHRGNIARLLRGEESRVGPPG